MAITGSGTQDDPWVVHNYTELVEKCGASPTVEPSDHINHVLLAQDIDCNNYGVDFIWNSVNLSNTSGNGHPTYLNLGGHTIKNIKVEASSKLFHSNWGSANNKIYNGKILNVFFSSNSVFSTGIIYLENLSFSVDISASDGQIFGKDNRINYCSIYARNYGSHNSTLHIIASSQIEHDNDYYLDYKYGTGKPRIIVYYSNMATIRDTRIRGRMSGQYDTAVSMISNCRVVDSVIDVDMTDVFNAVTSFSPIQTSNNSNSVVNTDTWKENFSLPSNLTAVTTQELASAGSLNSKGFVVALIEE